MNVQEASNLIQGLINVAIKNGNIFNDSQAVIAHQQALDMLASGAIEFEKSKSKTSK